MDPINILVGLNLILIFGANLGAAKKGIRSQIGAVKEKPKGFLQIFPPLLATIILVLLILAVFGVGTLSDFDGLKALLLKLQPYRYLGLLVYFAASWGQVIVYKTMGESYSQDIVIMKNHKLIQSGLFKYLRHPYYLLQILSDLGSSFCLFSYLVFPLALIEIPILISRAKIEEQLLQKHFPEQFKSFRQKAGFMLPFIG